MHAFAQTFFTALQDNSLELVEPLLADNVIEVIPLAADGGQAPWNVFEGKQAVMGYLASIVTNFSQVRLEDLAVYADEEAGVVFAEGRGDLVHAATGKPYRNRYVFKFQIADGKIHRIDEYANPVTFAKLIGAPIG